MCVLLFKWKEAVDQSAKKQSYSHTVNKSELMFNMVDSTTAELGVCGIGLAINNGSIFRFKFIFIF